MSNQKRKAAEKFAREIGDRIRSYRRSLGITRAYLAVHAGMSPRAVRMIERGRAFPSVQGILKLCHASDMTPNYILGWEAEGQPKED